MSRLLKAAKARIFLPELYTRPRVYYIDLYKMTKYFIAGTVVYGDTDECAEGVTVSLISNNKSAKITTNNYGSFEFDGLEIGKYTVRLECAGYVPETISVDLKIDSYLGDIILNKA